MRAAGELRQPALLPGIGEALRADRIFARGDRGIGRGQFEQRDVRRAQRDGRLVRQRRRNAEIARRADHVRHAHLLDQASGGDVAGNRERLTQRNIATIAFLGILRRPVADRHRLVLDHRIGRHPLAHRRQIDEQLEGRSGLAKRLRRAVEGAVLIGFAADHRDHGAVGLHRHQRDLRLVQPGASDRPLSRLLQPDVERRLHRGFGADLAGVVARCGKHPIGEIGAVGQLARAADMEHGGPCARRLRPGDEMAARHRSDDHRLARLRALQIAGRRQRRRRFHQSREHRGLANRQLAGLAVEIMFGRGGEAINVIAEIDVRQIARQDLILGQPRLQPEGDEDFAQLAPHRAIGIEKRILGELLRDRAAAFTHAAGSEIVEGGAQDAARIDPPVMVEAPILDRDEGVGHIFGQLGGIDRLADDGAAPRNRRAVRRQQGDRRRRRRLQRFRQRRGDRQPGDDQHEQDQQCAEPAHRPAQLRRAPFGRGGRLPPCGVAIAVTHRLVGARQQIVDIESFRARRARQRIGVEWVWAHRLGLPARRGGATVLSI